MRPEPAPKSPGAESRAADPMAAKSPGAESPVAEPMTARSPDAHPMAGAPADRAAATATPTPAPAAGPAAQPTPAASPATQPPANGLLLRAGERDALAQRMQQALTGFVDSPQRAVEEAAGVLETAADHLTTALAERRRSLRTGWDGREGATDTEHLRVTLRAYREMTERLLRL
ncbi:hypothetical protein QWM81_28295 [Streptomyces ficellus]|uniref:Uncharacterized protein n=1 Tax=Streptomyces ficellus TaxID=1977088 RepID=A0ABT7ZED6_9ACTN|nr:hypothetical protein [Streptomyces ficellus]MDN3297870.1 hypothetical protein [Streptomyces ficellus]